MIPFIIYALPRSRTYWLSKFLSHGAWKCGHDEVRYIRGLDDVKSLLDAPFYGSAETAAAPWWRLIHAMRKDIKPVVIRRPVDDVMTSLFATGVAFDEAKLLKTIKSLDAKLDQIEARVPGVLSVAFDDLNTEEVCARIYEHCTGQPHNSEWYNLVAPMRLIVDLEAMVRYCQAHEPQLQRIGRLAKQRILAKISRRPVASDSFTFQQESLEQFIADAPKLFGQHLIEVGEHPDAWRDKNLELMGVLESLGVLHITTARSNGRMFGYIMSLTAPALDSRTGRDGLHTLFYVSPEAPGLALKLQRASVEFLRSQGCDQIAFRAGTRGPGEKMSAIYRRIGAQDAGHMFTLDFKEAV
ncbi:MAG TPA: hypothetical protein PLI96_07975 [Halothiobacillus sp.]|nr:hypothetical protein [Halothiobacillus sp.]